MTQRPTITSSLNTEASKAQSAVTMLGRYVNDLPEAHKDKAMLVGLIKEANGGLSGIYQTLVRLNSVKQAM